MNSAQEELEKFAESHFYKNKNNLHLVCRGNFWRKPCSEWSKDDVKEAKSKISEVIRGLPFAERYDLLDVMNGFMRTYFHNRGYQALKWEKYRETSEIEIEILKLAQGGTNPELNRGSREKLAEKLHFSVDALKPYLSSLQNGKDLLGSEVKIELERGKTIYDSTVHPVFLALNLTEVNFLVNQLRIDYEGTKFENVAEQVSYDIYRQLSEYAKERIDIVAEHHHLDLTKSKSGKRLRKGYHKEVDMQEIPYLVKCSECIITDKKSGEEIAVGHVTSKNKIYYFVKRDGTEIKLDEKYLIQYQVKPYQK